MGERANRRAKKQHKHLKTSFYSLNQLERILFVCFMRRISGKVHKISTWPLFQACFASFATDFAFFYTSLRFEWTANYAVKKKNPMYLTFCNLPPQHEKFSE